MSTHSTPKPDVGHHETANSSSLDNVDSLEDASQRITWRTWIAILCASMSTFVGLLTITGAAGVLSFLVADFGRPDLIAFIIAGPTIMQATLAPFMARLADLTGQRKWILVFLCVWGIAGAGVGVGAKKMEHIVLAQFLMGVTASCVGITSAIPSEVLPNNKRAWGQSTVMWSANAASLVGSIGTGGMVDVKHGYRIMYGVMVGGYVVTTLGFLLVYNPPKLDVPKLSFGQILYKADAFGAALLGVTQLLLLLGLTWGGGIHPWKSAATLGPICAGGVTLIAFILYQKYYRTDGLVDHRLFRLGRNFGLALFAMMVEGWVYFTPISAYVPREIRAAGWASTGLLIGARSFIFTATTFATAIPLAFYVTRSKDVRGPLIIGFTLFLIANIMFAQAKPGIMGDRIVMGGLALAGIGFSAPLVLLNMVVQLSAPPELIATVTSIVASFRAVGGSVGSAVLGSILNNRLAKNVPARVVPAALAAGLPQSSVARVLGALAISPALLATVPGVTPAITAAIIPQYQLAQTESYAVTFYSLIPVIVLALVAVAALKSVAPQMTSHIDRPYEVKNAPDSEVAGSRDEKA